ncbi:MAG: hypothetical protein IJP43_00575 [Oscillospiraceae bacterium]|nr:hypothetical protein [Oscillospiraceae bacterium]
MTNKKVTRRALLMSVTSLLICISMLLGTTFAWFTDEVTSGVNQIVAGNLDVELYHKNPTVTADNVKVDTDTELFTTALGAQALWEPEAMAYETFTIKNVGTLALKYQLSLIEIAYNAVTWADGNPSGITAGTYNLTQPIYFGVVAGDATPTRASIKALYDAGNMGTLSAAIGTGTAFIAKAAALEAGASESFSIVLYWPQTNLDNQWNLKNGAAAANYTVSDSATALNISSKVQLLASQQTSESDSFDNQYDVSATTFVGTQIASISSVRATETAKAGVPTVFTAGSVGDTLSSTKATVSADAINDDTEVTLIVEESENTDAVATITPAEGTPLYFDVSLEDQNGAEVELAENGYVDVELDIGKDLIIHKVNHRLNELTTDKTMSEYYSYNSTTGILTLHVTSLSPFSMGYEAAVAKVGDVYYTSLNSAISAGSDVVIIRDILQTTGIDVNKDLTIDLNGNTLIFEPAGNNSYWGPTITAFNVKANKTLNLVDTSSNKGLIKIDPRYTCTVTLGTNRGTLNIDGVSIWLGISTYNQTVDGATFKTTCATNRATVNGISNYGTINVNGASFTNKYCGYSFAAITSQSNANATINGAMFNVTEAGTGYVAYNGSSNEIKNSNFVITEKGTGITVNGADANIDGCTIDMSGTGAMSASSAYGIYVNNSATAKTEANIEIKGNTKITSAYSGSGATALKVNFGKVVIDGANINDNGNGYAVRFGASALLGFENSAQLEIKSGTFVGDVQSDSNNGTMEIKGGSFNGSLVATGADRENSIKVYGGTFSVNPSNVDTSFYGIHNYVAEGYEAVDNGNSTWTVAAVAQ